uniref:Uncharacterized protein n=1 Tax=Anguilla anguilla TaxID=7936 RepID=A0A0E9UBN2_ANGAN
MSNRNQTLKHTVMLNDNRNTNVISFWQNQKYNRLHTQKQKLK